MKLHAFHFQFAMPQTHNQAIGRFGRHLQTRREARAFNYQRMITAGTKRFFEPGENGFAVVLNPGRLSVKQSGRANDLASEHLPDSLMTEADTENWNPAREMLDDFHR